MAQNKLYVGNLSFKSTEESLRAAFSAYGTVTRASIVTDRETGRSRGFGFVEMASDEEAQKAIDGLNGQSVDGRQIQVNVARPREEGGGSRGGGGGRSFGGGGGYGGHGGGGGGYGGGGGRGPSGGGGGWGAGGGNAPPDSARGPGVDRDRSGDRKKRNEGGGDWQ